MKRIFLSYSNKDEEWKVRVLSHLRALEIEGLCSIWNDRRIILGDAWPAEIAKALSEADIGLLLISADFLSSDFIRQQELPRLIERRDREGLRIIPIILKPCAWQLVPSLAETQTANKNQVPLSSLGDDHLIDVCLAEITGCIAHILKEGKFTLANLHQVHNLRTRRNYIRRRQIDKDIISAIDEKVSSIIYLFGPSGSGKTFSAENALHHFLNNNKFNYIVAIKPPPLPSFSEFINLIAESIYFSAIREVPPENRPSILRDLLSKNRALILIDSFEVIRNDESIVAYLLNLPHPTQLVITSTVVVELQNAKYIEVNPLSEEETASFGQLYTEKFFPHTAEAPAKNLDRLYPLSKGFPSLIVKVLSLIFLRRYDIVTLESALQAKSTQATNYSILDFVWSHELSDMAKFALMVLTKIHVRVSKSVIGNIMSLEEEQLDLCLLELFSMQLIEYPSATSEFVTLHDTVYYFIRGMRDSGAITEGQMTNVERAVDKVFVELITVNGGKANYVGFKQINKNWLFVWEVAKSVILQSDSILKVTTWKNLETFLYYYGHLTERMLIGEEATKAALRIGDRGLCGRIALEIAECEWLLHKNANEVLEMLNIANEELTSADDKLGMGIASYYKGRVLRQLFRYPEAEQKLEAALSIARAMDDIELEGYALNNLGNLYVSTGELRRALRMYQDALQLWEQIGDVVMVAIVHRNLVKVYVREGSKDGMELHYKKALETFAANEIVLEAAQLKLEIARFYMSVDPSKARTLLAEARSAFSSAGLTVFLSRVDDLESQMQEPVLFQLE